MGCYLAASYSKSDIKKNACSAFLGGRALIGRNHSSHSHWSGQFIAAADGSCMIGETFFQVRGCKKAVSSQVPAFFAKNRYFLSHNSGKFLGCPLFQRPILGSKTVRAEIPKGTSQNSP